MGRKRLSIPTVRVTIRWNRNLLDALDEMCRITGKTRGNMVQGIIESYYESFKESIEEHPEMIPIIKYNGKKRACGAENSTQ